VQRYTLGSADLTSASTPVVSPDGRIVVFSVRSAATRQLYRRQLDSFVMTPVPGTEDGIAPFFSPDGAWIGFMTASAIRKIPTDGGAAQTILSEPRVDGADWGADGFIYFSPRAGGADARTALARVPATGGKPEVVAVLDSAKGESEAWLPELLPDGKTVLVTISGGSASGWQVVAFRPGGSRHLVVENALLGRYMRSGHLFYYDFDSQVVLAAPFDPARAIITGPAIPMTEPVDNNHCFDVTDDGKLVYVPTPGAGDGDEVVWLDRKGAATPAMETKGPWVQPRVSPDGRKVLLRKASSSCELWLLDVERRTLSRAAQGNDHHDAVWGPDGRRIAYQQLNSRGEMYTITVEGAREITKISQGAIPEAPGSWSAGGNLLAYTVTGRGTRSDIWIRAMSGSSPPTPFLATEFNEGEPAISPDGRWIAYTSNETGSPEVYIRPYPDTGTTWQVSRGGGAGPIWSRDGRELYFTVGSTMMVVAIDAQPTLRIGSPTLLFEGGFNVTRGRDYDVAPGGRFVAVRRIGGGSRLELRMLLNWQEELRRTAGPSH
jgi:Tol biopolymer transport system component